MMSLGLSGTRRAMIAVNRWGDKGPTLTIFGITNGADVNELLKAMGFNKR